MSSAASPTELALLALQRLEQEIDDAHWQELLRRHGQALEDVYQEHARISRALAGLPRGLADPQRPAAILAAIPWRAPETPRRFWRPSRIIASSLAAACVVVLIVLDRALTEPPTPPRAVHQETAMVEHAPAEVGDLPMPALPVATAPDAAPAPVQASQSAQSPVGPNDQVADALGQQPRATATDQGGASSAPAADGQVATAALTPARPADALLRAIPAPAGSVAENRFGAPSPTAPLATSDRTHAMHEELSAPAARAASPDVAAAASAPVASTMKQAPVAGLATPDAATEDTTSVVAERVQQAALPAKVLTLHELAARPSPWSCALTLSWRPALTAEIVITATLPGVLPRGAVSLEGCDAQGQVLWRSSAVTPRADLSLEAPSLRQRLLVTIPSAGLPQGLRTFQVRIPGATSPSVALTSASAQPAAAAPPPTPGH